MATQTEVEAQATLWTLLPTVVSTFATAHCDAPPSGWDEEANCPFSPTATQRLVDGQATLFQLRPAIGVTVHLPLAGSFEVTTFPDVSTPTHSDVVGHETEVTSRTFAAGGPSISAGADHVKPLASAGGAIASIAMKPATTAPTRARPSRHTLVAFKLLPPESGGYPIPVPYPRQSPPERSAD
jgi:hypothetical protein